MLSKSKPIIPDAAIFENDSTYLVDMIDSTSKNKFLLQWLNPTSPGLLGLTWPIPWVPDRNEPSN